MTSTEIAALGTQLSDRFIVATDNGLRYHISKGSNGAAAVPVSTLAPSTPPVSRAQRYAAAAAAGVASYRYASTLAEGGTKNFRFSDVLPAGYGSDAAVTGVRASIILTPTGGGTPSYSYLNVLTTNSAESALGLFNGYERKTDIVLRHLASPDHPSYLLDLVFLPRYTSHGVATGRITRLHRNAAWNNEGVTLPTSGPPTGGPTSGPPPTGTGTGTGTSTATGTSAPTGAPAATYAPLWGDIEAPGSFEDISLSSAAYIARGSIAGFALSILVGDDLAVEAFIRPFSIDSSS